MECEKKEYQLQAVCFAASTAVFIVCFERAVVRSFIEQWRVLMFLALNLLLLAILFTSTRPNVSTEGLQNSNGVQDLKAAESKKKRKQCRPLVYADKIDDEGKITETDVKIQENAEANVKQQDNAEADVKNQENDEADTKQQDIAEAGVKNQENAEADAKQQDSAAEVDLKDQACQLSKEELNERVEAFIAMFRQHLISDAKGRSCRRLHTSSKKNGENILPKHIPVCPCRGIANHI